MAVDIPNTPTNGQTLTVGTRTWQYNSTTTTWEVVSGGAAGGGLPDVMLLGGM